MTTASAVVEVMNSLLYVRDPALSDFPEIDGKAAVWYTRSCLAISCLPDSEGPTIIVIGPSGEVGRGRSLVFDGDLPTPSRELIVDTVMDERVLRGRLRSDDTRSHRDERASRDRQHRYRPGLKRAARETGGLLTSAA